VEAVEERLEPLIFAGFGEVIQMLERANGTCEVVVQIGG
jgi:hypothetical protein